MPSDDAGQQGTEPSLTVDVMRRQSQIMAESLGVKFVPLSNEEISKRLNRNDTDKLAAYYDGEKDEIVFNLGFTPVKGTKTGMPAQWLSTDDPSHTVEHELAHKYHRDIVGAKNFADPDLGEVPDDPDKISEEVSGYASRSRASSWRKSGLVSSTERRIPTRSCRNTT